MPSLSVAACLRVRHR